MPRTTYVWEYDEHGNHVVGEDGTWNMIERNKAIFGADGGRVGVKPEPDFPMFISKKFDAYESPVTGEVIQSERQRREDMAKSNCVEYDPEMKTDQINREKSEQAAIENKIDETVEKQIMSMSSDKKERLANEMSTTELTYERGTANG